jgi:hypothetical protein
MNKRSFKRLQLTDIALIFFQALPPSQDSISVQTETPNLPPSGELPRTLPKLGDKLYAMRGSILNVWKEGTVIEVIDKDGETLFKLRFETPGNGKSRSIQTKILSLKHLAYSEPATVRLQVKFIKENPQGLLRIN